MDSSRPSREPVRPLCADRRISARNDQSSSAGVVHPRGNLEPRGAERGRVCDGSGGSAAGVDVSGAGDGRGLQHAARRRARAPRSICARHPGPAGRQLGPNAAGNLSVRCTSHLADRSVVAQGPRRDGGQEPGHQAGQGMLRQAQRPAGSVPDRAHGWAGAGRCQRAIAGGATDQRIDAGPDEPDRQFDPGRRRRV